MRRRDSRFGCKAFPSVPVNAQLELIELVHRLISGMPPTHETMHWP
jgi:hypothetical protein